MWVDVVMEFVASMKGEGLVQGWPSHGSNFVEEEDVQFFFVVM